MAYCQPVPTPISQHILYIITLLPYSPDGKNSMIVRYIEIKQITIVMDY